jgi:hypothetical protein
LGQYRRTGLVSYSAQRQRCVDGKKTPSPDLTHATGCKHPRLRSYSARAELVPKYILLPQGTYSHPFQVASHLLTEADIFSDPNRTLQIAILNDKAPLVVLSSVMQCTSLPVPIKQLSQDTKQFEKALKGFLHFHSFYSLEEYFNTAFFNSFISNQNYSDSIS